MNNGITDSKMLKDRKTRNCNNYVPHFDYMQEIIFTILGCSVTLLLALQVLHMSLHGENHQMLVMRLMMH